jgi:spore coat protein U-like protein
MTQPQSGLGATRVSGPTTHSAAATPILPIAARNRPRRRHVLCGLAGAAALVCALFAAPAARAGTATGTLSVSITITASCTISATATLAFGSVTGASLATTDPTSNTAISVTCTSGSPYAIGMGLGANASGNQRRMTSGGSNYLNYGLYQSTGTTQPWTTATNSTTCTTAGDCVLGSGTGSASAVTVYGDVPSGQTPVAGSFTDSVTMTVYY